MSDLHDAASEGRHVDVASLLQSHADPLMTHEQDERASAEADPRNDMSTVVEEESHPGSSSDSDATTVSNVTDRAWKSGGDVGGLGGGELRSGAVAGRRDRGGASGVVGDGRRCGYAGRSTRKGPWLSNELQSSWSWSCVYYKSRESCVYYKSREFFHTSWMDNISEPVDSGYD